MMHIYPAPQWFAGADALSHLPEYLAQREVKRAFVMTDPGVQGAGTLEALLPLLASFVVEVHVQAGSEPTTAMVDECCAAFQRCGADVIIAVGGGSVLDTAKCVAVLDAGQPASSLFAGIGKTERPVRFVAIPTTAGTGSEVTPIAVLTNPENQVKQGIVGAPLLPDLAILAPEMTRHCPPAITAASGVDALVHGVEAYLSLNANPLSDALALNGIALIVAALPRAYRDGADQDARQTMAIASLMTGMAFASAGVAAVHALAYPLGGRFHLSHGVSNALMLPHVMNASLTQDNPKLPQLARALGVTPDNAADRVLPEQIVRLLSDFCHALDIPSRLRDFGIPKSAIADLSLEASKIERLLKNNPVTLSVTEISKIYHSAY